MAWTGSQIRMKMIEEDRWLYRGLLAIHNKQTADEQRCRETKEDNGVGFNGVDAQILSKYAEDYKKYKRLTPKQLAVCRNKMLKYANQLAKIANMKGE